MKLLVHKADHLLGKAPTVRRAEALAGAQYQPKVQA